jgi:hypothetical protein
LGIRNFEAWNVLDSALAQINLPFSKNKRTGEKTSPNGGGGEISCIFTKLTSIQNKV